MIEAAPNNLPALDRRRLAAFELVLDGTLAPEKLQQTLDAILPAPSKALVLDCGKGVTMKVVRIPGGRFLMGSPGTETGRDNTEGPQREVTIRRPFHLGVTEVTQGQWQAVMGTQPWKGKENAKEGADRAANYISWDDAVLFCRKLSIKSGRTVQLPTEAQWEYACRAGTKTAYSFGDDPSKLGDYAWYGRNRADDGEERPQRVARKKPNAWGLYDMHGNVREWCSDWHAKDYYSNGATVDPLGPNSGVRRVSRGGAWWQDPKFIRSAARIGIGPSFLDNSCGFRVLVLRGPGDE